MNTIGTEDPLRTDRQPPMGMDRLLEVLASAQRRRVVRFLSEREGPIAFERLATVVADGDPDAVRLALHHTHLPKLAENDVVVLDRESGTVEAGPQLPTVANGLSAIEGVYGSN
jgi:hypothetical protein